MRGMTLPRSKNGDGIVRTSNKADLCLEQLSEAVPCSRTPRTGFLARPGRCTCSHAQLSETLSSSLSSSVHQHALKKSGWTRSLCRRLFKLLAYATILHIMQVHTACESACMSGLCGDACAKITRQTYMRISTKTLPQEERTHSRQTYH